MEPGYYPAMNLLIVLLVVLLVLAVAGVI